MPSSTNLIGRSTAKKKKYEGPTKFMGQWVGQDHTPTEFIKGIMTGNDATGFTSILEIGFPGSGKTTLAEMIAHRIHTARPEFTVLWAGANEMRDMENFLNSLPKTPHIVIFDDVSMALKSMDAKKSAKVFEILTQGRHITSSKLIIISIVHYSNSIEKAIRAQNIFYLYTSTSLAEDTNIRAIIEKDKHANQNYNRFRKAFISMFKTGSFELKIGKGKWQWYQRDRPFRVGFSIDIDTAKVFLFTKQNCAKCAQVKTIKKMHANALVKRMQHYEPRAGVQALSIHLAQRGYLDVFPRALRQAYNFISKILEEYDVDFEQLKEETIKARHYAHPRFKADNKKDREFLELIKNDSYIQTVPTIKPLTGMEIKIMDGITTLFN